MPLRALLDGQSVVSTQLDDPAWDAARRAVRADRGALRMACCGHEGRPWRSRRGLRYFRHQPHADCAVGAGETADHLEAKAVVAAAAQEAGWTASVEVAGPGWVADVLAERDGVRVALEVQWSAQTLERYQERQEAYRAAGVHGVWFARKLPAGLGLVPTRELPVFRLERNLSPAEYVELEVQDRFAPLELLAHVGRTGTLREAVLGLLTGAVKHRTQVGGGGAWRRVALSKMPCYRCDQSFTVYRVEPGYLVGACGYRAELPGGGDRIWLTGRPEADPAAVQAARQMQASEGLPALAPIRSRFSRTAGKRYDAFCCPHCGAMQGDFFLLATRDDVEGRFLAVGAPEVTAWPHWCHGDGNGRHCPA